MNFPISSKDESPLLASVRNAVAKKDAGIPYFLMPVRLETRFLRRETIPIVSDTEMRCVEILVSVRNDILKAVACKGTLEERTLALVNTRTDMAAYCDELKALPSCEVRDTIWLNDSISIIKKAISGYKQRIARTTSLSIKDRSTLDKLRVSLAAQWDVLETLFKELLKSVSKKSNYVEAILNQCTSLKEDLTRLADAPKISSTNKQRKNLHKVLDNYNDVIVNRVNNIRTLLSKEQHFSPSDYAEVSAALSISKKESIRTQNAINTLSSEFKKSEYSRLFDKNYNKSIAGLFNEFDTLIASETEFLNAINRISGSSLYHDILETESIIRDLLSSPLKTYADICAVKQKIYDALKTVRNAGRFAIDATPAQVVKIRSQYDNIDSLLADFSNSISKVIGKTRAEKTGLSRAMTQINHEYRIDLGGLRTSSPLRAPIVNFQMIRQSAKSWNSIIACLTETKKALEQVPLTKNNEFLTILQSITVVLPDECSKIIILPNSYLTKIQAMTRSLCDLCKKTVESSSGSSKVSKEILTISETIVYWTTSLTVCVPDIRDKFYDEFRKCFLFINIARSFDSLCVRIYPDDIAITTHEDGLTQKEIDAAVLFWCQTALGGSDKNSRLGAWRSLAARYGIPRATYISQTMRPENYNIITTIAVSPLVEVIDFLKRYYAAIGKIQNENPLRFETIRKMTMTFESILRTVSQCQHDDECVITRLIAAISRCIHILGKFEKESEITSVIEKLLLIDTAARKIRKSTPEENIEFAKARLKFPKYTVTKESSWSSAPHTNVLPDRFSAVTLCKDSVTHATVGAKIPNPLQVGIDPSKAKNSDTLYTIDNEGNLVVDEDIRWMLDFDTAVEKGMGLVIELDRDEAENGIDQLFVLGVCDEKNTATPLANKLDLENLFKAHMAEARGMEIVPIKTPTNASSLGSSGYKNDSSAIDDAFNNVFEMAIPPNDPWYAALPTDGNRLAHALGISQSLFTTLKNYNQRTISDSLLVNRAVSGSTIGYYMEEMLNGIFPDGTDDYVREFMGRFVSGRGIVPSIRVGKQPYGILVSSALSRFDPVNGASPLKSSDRYDLGMWLVVSTFYEEWKRLSQESVAHAGNTGSDAQSHFVTMLGLQPTSAEHHFRFATNCARGQTAADGGSVNVDFDTNNEYSPQAISDAFVSLYLNKLFFDPSISAADKEEQRKIIQKACEQFKSLMINSRSYSVRFFNHHYKMTMPLIATALNDDKIILTDSNNESFISWLLENELSVLDSYNDISKFPSKTLFFFLLRQSLLLEYRKGAISLLKEKTMLSSDVLSTLGSGLFATTRWNLLFDSIGSLIDTGILTKGTAGTAFDQGSTIVLAQYLKQQSVINDPMFKNIKNLIENFQLLRSVPAASLAGSVSEHLDLCSYRLDPWILGFVNKRLYEMRNRKPEGIHLGAYGWLIDIRPENKIIEAQAIPQALNLTDVQSVVSDVDNQGYIFAPSMNHGITAAVLRSGYMAGKKTADLSNITSINLTSARVRSALKLIDGVTNGHSLEELLGYQFERGLHEGYPKMNLDKYIYDLRRAFPALGVTNSDQPNRVVNGLSLLKAARVAALDNTHADPESTLFERMHDNGSNAFAPEVITGLAGIKHEGINAILQEIDKLADVFDALSDLMVSESVYQISQGNRERASTVLNVLSTGKQIPRPHIVDTMRTGTIVNHTIIATISVVNTSLWPAGVPTSDNLAQSGAVPSGWGSHFTTRALAEPMVNKWLGDSLGNGNDICIMVTVKDGNAITEYDITPVTLGLQPIDLMYLYAAGLDNGGEELKVRVERYLRATVTTLSSQAEIFVNIKSRSSSWAPNVKSLYEIVPLLQASLTILTDCRSANAVDCGGTIAGQELSKPAIDVDECVSRILRANVVLEDTVRALNVAKHDIDTVQSTDISALCKAIDICMEFGIENAVAMRSLLFSSLTTELSKQVSDRITALLQICNSRKNTVAKHLSNTIITPQMCTDAAKALFGKSFIVLHLFTLDTISGQPVSSINATSQNLLRAADPCALDGWLDSVAKVRTKMHALQRIGIITEMFDSVPLEYTPLQFPVKQGDYWLGIEYPADFKPDGDRASLVLAGSVPLTKGINCGFVVDEWMEIIPNREEIASVAYNFDQPDGSPPQCCIVAVPPCKQEYWSWDDLMFTLADTLTLSKTRCVETDQILHSPFTQLLPAIVTESKPGANDTTNVHRTVTMKFYADKKTAVNN